MTNQIFISYRRDDSSAVAGRLYDRLVLEFGKDSVFKDVDNIPLGVDFRNHLHGILADCTVLLAIIGPSWKSRQGHNSAIDDPNDFVRIEIESALSRNIPLFPVFVNGAVMPQPDEIPGSILPLVYRNGLPIRQDPDFHRDVDRLLEQLRPHVVAKGPTVLAPVESTRNGSSPAVSKLLSIRIVSISALLVAIAAFAYWSMTSQIDHSKAALKDGSEIAATSEIKAPGISDEIIGGADPINKVGDMHESLQIDSGTVSIKKLVSGEVKTPGQSHKYTFSGEAGQSIYLQVLANEDTGAWFSLVTPDGINNVFREAFTNSGPYTLDETGDYSLVVDPSGDATPKYEFRISTTSP